MVRVKVKGKKKYYVCSFCRSAYAQKKMAEKCEAWCAEHDKCNPKICGHAVKI